MMCHACRTHVTPTPPKTIWKVLNVAFWISTLAVGMVFSSLIGLNLILAPAAIAIAMSVGTSARLLSSWTCPRCNAELVEPEPQPSPAYVPAPPIEAPAPA
jgi:hypothetical protein